MRIVFDIDGVLLLNGTPENAYRDAKPNTEPIEGMRISPIAMTKVLQGLGHEIVCYTARGAKTGITQELMERTQAQLKEAGVPAAQIVFGKPWADCYVDDRSVSFRQLKELAMHTVQKGSEN